MKRRLRKKYLLLSIESFKGVLTEKFVAQELTAKGMELYYFAEYVDGIE
jgi:predicted AAA+ superfamily ATPase